MESPKKDTVQEESTTPQPKRTLFIRSLPTSATTEKLAEHFSQSYVIKHATVVTDSETKQSKGYGFVTFADLEDAQNALEEFNGSKFDGKKISVVYAQPRHREIDENLGKSVPSSAAIEIKKKRDEQKAAVQPPPKLIVRNLPWSIKEPEDLAAHFKAFGKVKHVTLPKKGTQLAGFGFVVLRGKKNAEKALASVNGKEVDGRTLAVDWAVDKSVWENLQKDSQEKEDEKEAAKTGDVEMADDAEGAADEAVSGDGEEEDVDEEEEDDEEEIDDMEDEEEEEDEDEEEKKEDDREACTIFIRNLPFTCTDESLYEHFTQFGPLRYARIVVDHETERPRGTGFVCFWKFEDTVSCVRDAPKQQEVLTAEKDKSKKVSGLKHSILQNENSDPSGRYTLEGRVLQIARAVSKSLADKLEEEGVSKRLVRDTDKRRLYLLNEGTIPSNSPMYKKLSPSEIKMREDSFKQRQNFIKKNPALHFSLTRLSIRNIPRHINSRDLKQLAREAVVGFAKDVKEGRRQPLSREETSRSFHEMKEAEALRREQGKGMVKQTKIVYEGQDGSKISEDSKAGRSRGYGFIEYHTHRHALMGLRWLNGHAVEAPKTAEKVDAQDRKKRLIVEFAIENAQVIKRRNEQMAREQARQKESREKDENKKKEDESKNKTSPNDKKRKRNTGEGQGQDGGEEGIEEENKLAKRNRIIAKKRAQRRVRKGKA